MGRKVVIGSVLAAMLPGMVMLIVDPVVGKRAPPLFGVTGTRTSLPPGIGFSGLIVRECTYSENGIQRSGSFQVGSFEDIRFKVIVARLWGEASAAIMPFPLNLVALVRRVEGARPHIYGPREIVWTTPEPPCGPPEYLWNPKYDF